ncbi:hypothetical protein MC7420_7833 [Coleofasciculus chthonoplastes PCC 7420]|uniref:Uncharacterized protein n=1 Tax=Coleofasciculus chthonoplastes PCC 7420 TaxID=118168 RepID=B4VIT8_9CYAN|nr:hypothetical protein MC7420_7833 [Coleofasciculus chthonoplastes PCC 7420]
MTDVRPDQRVVAWHTLFDELTISPKTVGAHGVRPIQS